MSRTDWPEQIFEVLKGLDVRQVTYVPHAGHRKLIRTCNAASGIRSVSLTSEEEGVATLGGAWLGGQRGVLLLQSSGFGNCINMRSLQHETRLPLFMIVTMRGEWREFNPWQVAMGRSTQEVLEASGVYEYRADSADDVAPTVAATGAFAYQTGRRAMKVIEKCAIVRCSSVFTPGFSPFVLLIALPGRTSTAVATIVYAADEYSMTRAAADQPGGSHGG